MKSNGDRYRWGEVCVCFFKSSTRKRALNTEIFEQRPKGSGVRHVAILRKGFLDSEKNSKCKDPWEELAQCV